MALILIYQGRSFTVLRITDLPLRVREDFSPDYPFFTVSLVCKWGENSRLIQRPCSALCRPEGCCCSRRKRFMRMKYVVNPDVAILS